MPDQAITLTDGTRTVECRVTHRSRRFIEIQWNGQGVRFVHRLAPHRGRLKDAEVNSPWHVTEGELRGAEVDR
jgi:hypothetical protein